MWILLRLLVGYFWIFMNTTAFLVISMALELEIFTESGAQAPVMQLAATVSQVSLGIALLAFAPGVLNHTRDINRRLMFFLTVMLVAATPLLLAFMILFLFLQILLFDLSASTRLGSLFAMIIAPSLLKQVVYQSLCYIRLGCSQETTSSPLFYLINAIITALESLTIKEAIEGIQRILEGIQRTVEGIARTIEPILAIFQKIAQIIAIPIRAFRGEQDPTPYRERTEHQSLRRNQHQRTHSNNALERSLVLNGDTSVQYNSCIPSASQSAPSNSNGRTKRSTNNLNTDSTASTSTTSQQLEADCYFSSEHIIPSSAVSSTSTSSTNSTASTIAMPTTSRRAKGKAKSKKSKNDSGHLNQEDEDVSNCIHLESFEQNADESHYISSDTTIPYEDLIFEHGHPECDPPPYYG